MIPVVVIQQSFAKVAGTDKNDLLIKIHAQLLGKNRNQIFDVIAVALLAEIAQKTEIAADRRRFDRNIFRQFP